MNLVSKVLSGLAAPVLDYFKQRQQIKADAARQEREIKEATVKRQVALIEQGLHADMQWELLMAEQAKTSWKDEYVLVLLSIPLILVFIPATAPYVLTGFSILDQTPQWYRWLILMIFTAIYGIRVWRRSQYDTE